MAKYKLDLEPRADVHLIGISSHVSEHRLCWSLNRQLGLEMGRCAEDITVVHREATRAFATFEHVDADAQVRYMLISNHCPGAVLFPEERRTDFFLVVDGDDPVVPDDLVERVRQADQVLTAFPLELDQLRGGHKLIR